MQTVNDEATPALGMARLYKVEEAAQLLDVSRAMTYQLMDRGELPYVKLGRCRRVSADAIRRLIETHTVGAGRRN